MAICPTCHREQAKRKNGACPACGAKVEVYKGVWYRAGTGNPPVGLLHHFEKRVSGVLSYGRPKPVIFTIPPKGLRYNRELVSAERLLDYAGHDLTLAKSAIDVLFDDNKFNFKTRDSLLYISREYLLALAVAKANREQVEEARKKERAAVSTILAQENIFG